MDRPERAPNIVPRGGVRLSEAFEIFYRSITPIGGISRIAASNGTNNPVICNQTIWVKTPMQLQSSRPIVPRTCSDGLSSKEICEHTSTTLERVSISNSTDRGGESPGSKSALTATIATPKCPAPNPRSMVFFNLFFCSVRNLNSGCPKRWKVPVQLSQARLNLSTRTAALSWRREHFRWKM